MADEKNVGWLLTAAKIVGAVVTIGGAILGVGGWLFTVVMTERDNKIEDLQADIDELNQSITHLSSQLDDSEERFTNLRIAMELLNARLELRTSSTGSPAPSVRVRRPAGGSGTVPVADHVEPMADLSGPRVGAPSPPFVRRSPPLEERVFHTDHDAEEEFNRAIADIGGSP